jgi:antitoxin ParD1/3/4
MEITLSPEAKEIIEDLIGSGFYQTPEDAVYFALKHLWNEREARLAKALNTPKTLEELEARLLESIESFERGEGEDGEVVMARLRERMKIPDSNS